MSSFVFYAANGDIVCWRLRLSNICCNLLNLVWEKSSLLHQPQTWCLCLFCLEAKITHRVVGEFLWRFGKEWTLGREQRIRFIQIYFSFLVALQDITLHYTVLFTACNEWMNEIKYFIVHWKTRKLVIPQYHSMGGILSLLRAFLFCMVTDFSAGALPIGVKFCTAVGPHLGQVFSHFGG